MSFTPIGVIIIIAGLMAFVSSTRWLVGLTVFFVPFSGTAVVNIGSTNEGSSIQPYMFLAMLCITKGIIAWFLNKDKLIDYTNRNLLAAKLFFAAFAAVAAVSLIMPVIINGKAMGNVLGFLDELDPIVYSSRNFTQYLYFLLGTIFSFFIGSYTSKNKHLFTAVKIFSYAIIFIIAWGALEFFCQHFAFFPYPVSVFNNSANAALAKETKFLEGGISRLTSVSAEPSIFAQQLVVYLPFLLVSIEKKVYIFSKIKDYLLAGLVIVFVFMTTSSSGIVCLALIIVIFVLTKKGIFTKKFLKLILQILAILVCIPIVYLIIPDIINSALLNKSDSYSALERLGTIVDGWQNFLQYPVLGVGWGAITVNDFVVKILSNTGVIGFTFIVLTVFFLLRQHILTPKNSDDDLVGVYLNRACILSFIILLINCEIAGFSFYFGIFWLILGFCMANKFKLKNQFN